nr:SDR family oxidoreductase [Legionellales bacterium]
TKGLATETAKQGIRVNAVRPGLIHTDIHASSGQPDRVARLQDQVPVVRGGAADQVNH